MNQVNQPMAARDWFGVVVRVIGLVVCLQSLENFYSWISLALGTGADPFDFSQGMTVTNDFAAYILGTACLKLTLGFLIIYFAPFIENMCYGRETAKEEIPSIEDL